MDDWPEVFVCHLCTKNYTHGRIWRAGIWQVCDECHEDIRYAVGESFDYRPTAAEGSV